MSSSGKDFDLASIADSDASLLSKDTKNQDTASHSKTNKRSLLSRLTGARRDVDSSSKTTTSSTTETSSSQGSDQKQQSGTVEDIYSKFSNMGTNTRLT